MKFNKIPFLICISLFSTLGYTANERGNTNNPNANISPQFVQYTLNLYNHVTANACYIDDITTRDSSLKKSGKIIYWFNGKKREIVDATVYRVHSTKGVIPVYELSGQISATYRCLRSNNFQTRYMFHDRLLKKMDKHTQNRIKEALIKQGKLGRE